MAGGPAARDTTALAPLPGSDRLYPSQEPRNQAHAGAAEAFPGRASAAPVAAVVSGTPALPETAPAAPAPPSVRSEAVPALSVQLLATKSRGDAERFAAKAGRTLPAVHVDADEGLYKVRTGAWADGAEARRWLQKARSLGHHDAFLVRITADVESSCAGSSEGQR